MSLSNCLTTVVLLGVVSCSTEQPRAEVQDIKAERPVPVSTRPSAPPRFAESATVTIPELQGPGHYSPYQDHTVTTSGVVTAISEKRFWIQSPGDDANPATSQGILVQPARKDGMPDDLAVGSLVTVKGICREQIARNHADALPVTTLVSESIQVSAEEKVAILPLILGQDRSAPPGKTVDSDTHGHILDPSSRSQFKPASDGLDYWESLEGMLIQLPTADIVSGVQHGNEFVVVLPEVASLRSVRGGIVLQEDDPNPERIIVEAEADSLPPLTVGDRFSQPLTGVVHYDWKAPRLILTAALPPLEAGGLKPESTTLHSNNTHLTIASFNIRNFNKNSKLKNGILARTLLGEAIAVHLGGPDIVALQEVQDNSGKLNDGVVNASESGNALCEALRPLNYQYVDVAPRDLADGGIPGGNIRCAFLYRPDRVTLISRQDPSPFYGVAITPNGSLSASPAVLAPQHEAFHHSRKPLVAEFQFRDQSMIIINLHLVSKRGDGAIFGAVQPPERTSTKSRLEQANVLADFVEKLQKVSQGIPIVVCGDFNDFHWSSPLRALTKHLGDPASALDPTDRYTYTYKGNAQQLDHILISRQWLPRSELDIVHICSEFSDNSRISDHDPLVLRLATDAP